LQPDSRSRVEVRPQTHAIIIDLQSQVFALEFRGDTDGAAFAHRRQPVADGIFQQRLQQQGRQGFTSAGIAARERHAQAIAESNLFDTEIVARELQLVVQRG
jgi:hypothetical protein